VRAQDVGLSGASDEGVLEWAAAHGRIVLTHDVRTMVGVAVERIAAEAPMPGLVEISRQSAFAAAIDSLELLIGASFEGEWENQVLRLPFAD